MKELSYELCVGDILETWSKKERRNVESHGPSSLFSYWNFVDAGDGFESQTVGLS